MPEDVLDQQEMQQDVQPIESNPPVVNMEEQILNNLLSIDPSESVPVGAEGFRDAPPIEEPKEGTPVDTLSYNPVWDYMVERAKQAGQEYQPPDFVKTRVKPDGSALTPQEEYDILLSEIAQGVQQQPVDDPFVDEYLKARETPEFELEQWLEKKVSTRSILESDDATFMKHYLTEVYGKTNDRPNGLTEEQIDEAVKKMDNSGVLSLQAIQNRDAYRKLLEQADHAERELRLSQERERMAMIQGNQQKLIDQLFDRKKEQKDIYGMPLSEAQKREFQEFFKNIMSIDPQKGVPKLHEFLANDDALYDAVFMMYLRDKGMKDFITGVKEDVKQTYIDKLDIKPKDVYQRTPVSPTPIDIGKLMQPEDS